MKKLLTLVAILPAVSLSAPCFGVDWIRDRFYTSKSLYGLRGFNYDLGYHYTDNVKISVGPTVKFVIADKMALDVLLMAKLHYHYKIEGTDITPYITFGVGGGTKISLPVEQGLGINVEKFFSYQIGSGINLPLSDTTNIFAGYKLYKFHEISHGIELGMSYNF
ncbi:P44/Msp2 family outer membrane protein [Wolbachia pipientis]|nr:P44/Msp2 family outer membrane protein [Wolbachia pipientis]